MERQRAELIHDQVLILAEAFGLPISERRQQIYVEALLDLDPTEIKGAVNRLIQTRTFAGNLPSVAEIRDAAGNGNLSLEDRALLAWDKLQWARNYCHCKSVAFDDPAIHGVIRMMGGWQRICEPENDEWNEDKIVWKRKEFCQLYGVCAQRPHLHTEPYFQGKFDAENERQGFLEHVKPPVLVSGALGNYQAEPRPELAGPEFSVMKLLEE